MFFCFFSIFSMTWNNSNHTYIVSLSIYGSFWNLKSKMFCKWLLCSSYICQNEIEKSYICTWIFPGDIFLFSMFQCPYQYWISLQYLIYIRGICRTDESTYNRQHLTFAFGISSLIGWEMQSLYLGVPEELLDICKSGWRG